MVNKVKGAEPERHQTQSEGLRGGMYATESRDNRSISHAKMFHAEQGLETA